MAISSTSSSESSRGSDATNPNLKVEVVKEVRSYEVALAELNSLSSHRSLPGPHFDPPSKEEVRSMIQECDINLDGEIDREEFSKFIQRLMGDTFIIASQGLILTWVVAPTVAMATKRAIKGIPGIGKVVQKFPNYIYASLVTLVVVLFQKLVQESN